MFEKKTIDIFCGTARSKQIHHDVGRMSESIA